MKGFSVLQQQERVNAYFRFESSYWKDIYVADDVYAEIHRDRHAVALDWIDSLAPAAGSRVLEIGCGAGFLSVALAQRGFRVHAIDAVDSMVEQARRHAAESGVVESLTLDVGDVYALAFGDASFDLVIALGVIPWLEQPVLAIQEMARVTRPDGYIILTADNRARLNILLDPWQNPVLAPLKRYIKRALERSGLRRQTLNDMGAISHSRRFIDQVLMRAGLVKTRSITLGFGPFSLFHRPLLPKSMGIALHHRLQRLVHRNTPVFRSTGAHYLVLARKTASPQSIVRPTNTSKPLFDATRALQSENGGFFDERQYQTTERPGIFAVNRGGGPAAVDEPL